MLRLETPAAMRSCSNFFREHQKHKASYSRTRCYYSSSSSSDPPSPPPPPREERKSSLPLTLCVEGNISSGKSTFLHEIIGGEHSSLRDEAFVVPEPVKSWQKIPGSEHNVLECFYKEPVRYAYTFQNYVFITRCLQYKNMRDETSSSSSTKDDNGSGNGNSGGAEEERRMGRFRVCERSIFSDRKVFVDSLMDAKWLTDMEFRLYNCWFDALADETLVPNAFIYLRASPETCKRRLCFRSRGEEEGVTLEYLRQLHEKHENWFREDDRTEEAPRTLRENVPKELENAVKFIKITLTGKKTFPFVPVLIVDGDKDFDVELDVEKNEKYAHMVRVFHRFVADYCNYKQQF